MPRCECGADAEACSNAWDECLALEYTQPSYGWVHHLTVAAYMLQHGSRLSREGWFAMRDQLRSFLDEGLDPQQARESWSAHAGEPHPSLLRGDVRGPSALEWSRHIVDVRRDAAPAYCEDIAAWAATVLEEASHQV